MKRLSLPWTTLVAFNASGSKQFIPATGWVNAADVARLRGTFEQRATTLDS